MMCMRAVDAHGMVYAHSVHAWCIMGIMHVHGAFNFSVYLDLDLNYYNFNSIFAHTRCLNNIIV